MLLPTLLLSAFPVAEVDLVLGPRSQPAEVGDVVAITLTAKAPASSESFTGVDAILSWDPSQLTLVDAVAGPTPWLAAGFLPDPDGINANLLDGEALYTVLATPGSPVSVPPDTLIATFTFTVIETGVVRLKPSSGTFGKTRVLSTTPGVEITGLISATAAAVVHCPIGVPVGGPIASLLVGCAIAALGVRLLTRRRFRLPSAG